LSAATIVAGIRIVTGMSGSNSAPGLSCFLQFGLGFQHAVLVESGSHARLQRRRISKGSLHAAPPQRSSLACGRHSSDHLFLRLVLIKVQVWVLVGVRGATACRKDPRIISRDHFLRLSW